MEEVIYFRLQYAELCTVVHTLLVCDVNLNCRSAKALWLILMHFSACSSFIALQHILTFSKEVKQGIQQYLSVLPTFFCPCLSASLL